MPVLLMGCRDITSNKGINTAVAVAVDMLRMAVAIAVAVDMLRI
jgi:thiazole synthase ThiGH ThiG subunit